MSIISNVGWDTADRFLLAFHAARREAKKASLAMKACAEATKDPAQKRRYDSAHKQMVKIIRDWNRIEEYREL